MAGEKTINFTRGVPATESFPVKEMEEASRNALEKFSDVIMQYGKAVGFQPLRDWLAAWRGVPTEQVMTSNGSLQMVEFLCFHYLKAGDVVFTESPTYDRTVTMLRRHGARVVGIKLDPDGPDIDALDAALKKDIPKFFYIIPDFQNPSGATCSLEKRKAVAERARRYGFPLVEDAPYRPLRYRGEEQPALADLAPESVLHMLSFSKLIGPGVRAGMLYAPAEIIAKIGKIAEDTYVTPNLFSQGAVFEFLAAGHLPGQIEKLKALYAPRLDACRDALREFLPGAVPTRPDGGFFLSVTLPEGVTTEKVMEKAKGYNLNLAPGKDFFPDGGGDRFLRLPYCALSPDEIREGIGRLAKAVGDVKSGK